MMENGAIVEMNTGYSSKHKSVMIYKGVIQCMDCCQWTMEDVSILDTVECNESLPANTFQEIEALEVKSN